MTTLIERDVVEKWSHIAMKLFPPQMDISVAPENGSWNVCARWKKESGGPAATIGANGVDLHFDEQSIRDYLEAGVDAQLKCDRFIEAAIAEKLRSVDPRGEADDRRPPERWVISLEECVTRDH